MKMSAPCRASARVPLIRSGLVMSASSILDTVHALGTALVDHPGGVADDDIFSSGLDQQFGGGDGGSAGPVEDNFDFGQVSIREFQGVSESGQNHHGSTVLVVVKYWNIKAFPQFLLDLKTPGRGNVFQVDAAESRGDVFHQTDHQIRFLGADADGKGLHAAEGLEQDGLAFHDRQGGPGADIPQTQDGAAVGDDGHQVVFAGVVIGRQGVLPDFFTNISHNPGRCTIFCR